MPTSNGSHRDPVDPADEPVVPDAAPYSPDSAAHSPDSGAHSTDDTPVADPDTVAVPTAEADAVRRHTSLGHTKAAATWTGLVIGTLVLILLLVFILQNLDSVTWKLFWWEFSLPLGVSLLLAAIAGALIMALAGGVRILQIRRLAKRATHT